MSFEMIAMLVLAVFFILVYGKDILKKLGFMSRVLPSRSKLHLKPGGNSAKQNLLGSTFYTIALPSIITFILLVVGYFAGTDHGYIPILPGVKVPYVLVAITLLVVMLIKSSREQEQNRLGAIFFFGRVVAETTPGYNFVFWPIFKFDTFKKATRQKELPTDIMKDENGEFLDEFIDEVHLPSGEYKRVPRKGYRMTHRHPENSKTNPDGEVLSGDPLDKSRLTTTVLMFFQYKLVNVLRYLTNLDGGEADFVKQVSDMVVQSTKQEFALRTTAQALTEWHEIERIVLRKVLQLVYNLTDSELVTEADKYFKGTAHKDMTPEAKLLRFLQTNSKLLARREGAFGVVVVRVGIKDIDLPHGVNSALSDVTSAIAKITEEQALGSGEKLRKIEAAEGEKAFRQAGLTGDMEPIKLLAKNLDMKPQQVVEMFRDHMRRSAIDGADPVTGIVGTVMNMLKMKSD